MHVIDGSRPTWKVRANQCQYFVKVSIKLKRTTCDGTLRALNMLDVLLIISSQNHRPSC